MARRMLLKAFSGPHLGAEAILADGEYTVGRGANCDLVFDDHAVAEEHLKLKVAGERVHAQPLGDARLSVGGKPTDGCTIPIGEYFTIGTTHLAVGFANEQWVMKPLPIVNLADEPTPAEPEPETTAVETKPAAPRRKTRVFALAGVAVVLSIVAWGAWMACAPNVQADVSMPDRTGGLLDEVIAKHGVSATVKTEKTERGWIVRGHLKNRDSLHALEVDCRKYLPDSAIRLWDSQTLAAASGEVLAAFRVAVAAAPGAPGEVVFQGRVPDAAQWARVRERIRHDVPALAVLTDNVLTGAGRMLRDSRGRLVDAATAPQPPQVIPGVGPYVIEVPYPATLDRAAASNEKSETQKPDAPKSPAPKPESKPNPVVAAQAPEISKPSAVKAPEAAAGIALPASAPNITYVAPTPIASNTNSTIAAVAAKKPEAPPVLAFQSVSVGATAWLRLADGTRVSVGGRIGGGYEITSISAEAIEAQRGETRIVYRLREGT